MTNLFKDIPVELPEELFETLLKAPGLHIERIISRAHSTPAGEWYDQAQNEWVLVLKGGAEVRYDDGTTIRMNPGDYLEIPAHQKHRVTWTHPELDTIWLAIHFAGE